jgi:hypothetical protein
MLKPSDCVRTSTSCTFNKKGDAFGVAETVVVDIVSVSLFDAEGAGVLTSTSRDDMLKRTAAHAIVFYVLTCM